MLKPVTKTLKDVQMDIMEMVPPNAILIGQSLNCDLHAMQVSIRSEFPTEFSVTD